MTRFSCKDFPEGHMLSKQRLFLFLYFGLHYLLFFSEDDTHVRGKISLLLRDLPHYGGGKGFLNTSSLQVHFSITETSLANR